MHGPKIETAAPQGRRELRTRQGRHGLRRRQRAAGRVDGRSRGAGTQPGAVNRGRRPASARTRSRVSPRCCRRCSGRSAPSRCSRTAGLLAHLAAPARADGRRDRGDAPARRACAPRWAKPVRGASRAKPAPRTGDYLLAHRIPKPVQALLKRLPAPLAARVLLAAITRHAWTFAGSGRFEAHRPAGRSC